MSLASVKRGDVMVVTSTGGRQHQATVTAAGPAWITVGSTRYHRCDGHIEGGYGMCSIRTLDQVAAGERRAAANRQLELYGIERHRIPSNKLEAVVAALRTVFDDDASHEKGAER